jgi:hypothetical protein
MGDQTYSETVEIAGKKSFAIARIEDTETIAGILARLQQ